MWHDIAYYHKEHVLGDVRLFILLFSSHRHGNTFCQIILLLLLSFPFEKSTAGIFSHVCQRRFGNVGHIRSCCRAFTSCTSFWNITRNRCKCWPPHTRPDGRGNSFAYLIPIPSIYLLFCHRRFASRRTASTCWKQLAVVIFLPPPKKEIDQQERRDETQERQMASHHHVRIKKKKKKRHLKEWRIFGAPTN